MKKEDFGKKYKVKSKLEEEKLRKKLALEEEEKLDIVGQESDKKAAKWVIEDNKIKEKIEQKKEADLMTKLWDKRQQDKTYKWQIMKALYEMVGEIDWPRTYQYGVWYDGKGVKLSIRDKFGKVRQRAFKLTRNPRFDLHAAYKFAVWAEDILDMVEGRLVLPKTKGGIWLPPKKT